MKYLIVIDMQKDFVTGSLGSVAAQLIVPKIRKKLEKAVMDPACEIIFTQDTHFDNYLDTPEGQMLPVPHCLFETDGWKFAEGLIPHDMNNIINSYCKSTFAYPKWEKVISEKVEEIELCGVCTDICVISNALLLKSLYPWAKMVVDASCCAGTTKEKHAAALDVMSSCQIIINRKE